MNDLQFMQKLLSLAYQISTTQKADIMIDYYGHINGVSVCYHKDGHGKYTESRHLLVAENLKRVTQEQRMSVIAELETLNKEIL